MVNIAPIKMVIWGFIIVLTKLYDVAYVCYVLSSAYHILITIYTDCTTTENCLSAAQATQVAFNAMRLGSTERNTDLFSQHGYTQETKIPSY